MHGFLEMSNLRDQENKYQHPSVTIIIHLSLFVFFSFSLTVIRSIQKLEFDWLVRWRIGGDSSKGFRSLLFRRLKKKRLGTLTTPFRCRTTTLKVPLRRRLRLRLLRKLLELLRPVATLRCPLSTASPLLLLLRFLLLNLLQLLLLLPRYLSLSLEILKIRWI